MLCTEPISISSAPTLSHPVDGPAPPVCPCPGGAEGDPTLSQPVDGPAPPVCPCPGAEGDPTLSHPVDCPAPPVCPCPGAEGDQQQQRPRAGPGRQLLPGGRQPPGVYAERGRPVPDAGHQHPEPAQTGSVLGTHYSVPTPAHLQPTRL